MLLQQPFIQHLEIQLSKYENQPITINKVEKVSGGSVNNAYRLKTEKQSYFIKVNNEDTFPGLFESEAIGLQTLRIKSNFRIPEVLLKSNYHNNGYLILRYVQQEIPSQKFWMKFGENLAQLHQQSADYFGLDENNYNGSLIQVNSKKLRWADFFVENRLMFQCKLARDNQRVDSFFVNKVEKIYPKIEHLFPIEKPALLHGDLWRGNFLVGINDQPLLIDPAVYYGHREVDIAMSLLFGGFNKQLYNRYNEVFPLEAGWESRVDIANLYPLLVHVNLFGSNYAKRVSSVLNPFI